MAPDGDGDDDATKDLDTTPDPPDHPDAPGPPQPQLLQLARPIASPPSPSPHLLQPPAKCKATAPTAASPRVGINPVTPASEPRPPPPPRIQPSVPKAPVRDDDLTLYDLWVEGQIKKAGESAAAKVAMPTRTALHKAFFSAVVTRRRDVGLIN